MAVLGARPRHLSSQTRSVNADDDLPTGDSSPVRQSADQVVLRMAHPFSGLRRSTDGVRHSVREPRDLQEGLDQPSLLGRSDATQFHRLDDAALR